MQKRIVSGSIMVLALATAFEAGCGEQDPDSDGGGSGGTTSGSGGADPGSGGTGATGGSEGAAGGAGGGTGGVGGTCDPGTGGAPADLPCLDASEYSMFFTVEDPKLCVVGVYDSDVSVGFDTMTFFTAVPTWGRHGGPMIVLPGEDPGSARIVHLTAPATGTGTLTKTETVVADVTIEGSYLGSQAIDLPFFNWTLLSFTTDFGMDGGKVVLVDNDLVAGSYDTNGFFAGAAVGAPCQPGRLVYTGLTVLGDGLVAGAAAGIYAADSCGTDGVDERLMPKEGRTDCAAPLAVDTWGNASGPVVADSSGNVIAVATSYDATTGDPTSEVRGWAASQIARGEGAVGGAALFSVPGFGSSLASLAPAANDPGVIAFQSNDSETFTPLDVVGQRFSVASEALVASGPAATLFKLASAGTAVSMFNDIHGRMWLATNNPTGNASFFVVVRK